LFGPPGKEKSLELALETDYWTRYYEQTARRIYAQCRRFKSAPDNSFTEWQNLLEAAAQRKARRGSLRRNHSLVMPM
jgi:hypothetical protein